MISSNYLAFIRYSLEMLSFVVYWVFRFQNPKNHQKPQEHDLFLLHITISLNNNAGRPHSPLRHLPRQPTLPASSQPHNGFRHPINPKRPPQKVQPPLPTTPLPITAPTTLPTHAHPLPNGRLTSDHISRESEPRVE